MPTSCYTVGRYCEYMNVAGDRSNEFTSFEQYMGTLTLECDDGQPGTFTWTPDENTPDTVYYQVNWNHHAIVASVVICVWIHPPCT